MKTKSDQSASASATYVMAHKKLYSALKTLLELKKQYEDMRQAIEKIEKKDRLK